MQIQRHNTCQLEHVGILPKPSVNRISAKLWLLNQCIGLGHQDSPSLPKEICRVHAPNCKLLGCSVRYCATRSGFPPLKSYLSLNMLSGVEHTVPCQLSCDNTCTHDRLAVRQQQDNSCRTLYAQKAQQYIELIIFKGLLFGQMFLLLIFVQCHLGTWCFAQNEWMGPCLEKLYKLDRLKQKLGKKMQLFQRCIFKFHSIGGPLAVVSDMTHHGFQICIWWASWTQLEMPSACVWQAFWGLEKGRYFRSCLAVPLDPPVDAIIWKFQYLRVGWGPGMDSPWIQQSNL